MNRPGLKQLLVSVVILSSSINLFAAYSGGSGTMADPYKIATAADLIALGANIADYRKSFILTADIDLASRSFTQAVIAPDTSTGSDYQGTAFTGVFDGNGHLISNLKITATNKDYAGLFGFVGLNGQIMNVGLENANVSAHNYAGGLCGYNKYGAISRSYAAGAVKGSWTVGGLCGESFYGIISQSYAIPTGLGVRGEGFAGGLCGKIYSGTISQSYACGTVNGAQYAGGLCGYNYYDITITSSFWDMEASGQATSAGGTGQTTAQMHDIQTFLDAGWDFSMTDGDTADWIMKPQGYPALSWEKVLMVPVVTGLTQARAVATLLAAGLGVGSITHTPSGLVVPGQVISQYPPAGEKIRMGGPVNLLVSLKYSGGSGTAADPYQIATVDDMIKLGQTPDDYNEQFIVTADLDLSRLLFDRAVIAPDRNNAMFTGVFDGAGHVITGLTINGFQQDYTGLFGSIGPGSQIRNLRLENVFLTGRDYVGSLCGWNDSGTISQCCAGGIVAGNAYAGGLCGENYSGTISQCYAGGTVTGNGYIGGLVGENYSGTIKQSYTRGAVTGTGNMTGGLCGYNYAGIIDQSFAGGAVTGSGNVAGGLCGWNGGLVTDSYWNIESSGQPASAGGWGLTSVQMKQAVSYPGWNDGSWSIQEGLDIPFLSWENRDGSVIATGYPPRTYGGGGTAESPYQMVSADDILCLSQRTADWNSHFLLMADINLEGLNFSQAVIAGGGGCFTGVWDGNGRVLRHLTIDGAGQDFTGLFSRIGKGGQVMNLGLADVKVTGQNKVGSLCGYNSGRISQCYASGSVTGTGNFTGALCGINDGTINRSYCSGTVTGNYCAGGLCGYNYGGAINQSYACGEVMGSYVIGGLCGYNYGTISQSYASGKMTGSGKYIGGLCGYAFSGTVTGSFWDTQASGTPASAGGTGQTTAQMQDVNTYHAAGWDFSIDGGDPADWMIPAGEYPCLTRLGNRLEINPGALSFTLYDAPVMAASQAVTLSGNMKDPSQPCTWQAQEECSWLSVTPETGSSVSGVPQTLTVTIDAFGLQPGVYYSRVQLICEQVINNPVTVPVQITILDSRPKVSPSRIYLTGIQGSTVPLTQTLTIGNTGDGTLSWQADFNQFVPGLTMEPLSGELAPLDNQDATVTVDLRQLPAGNHSAELIVRDTQSSSQANIPISITVKYVAGLEEFASLSECWLRQISPSSGPCQQVDWLDDDQINVRDLMQLVEAWLTLPEPPIDSSGLISFWPFDQDGQDNAGLNHGTLTNGAAITTTAGQYKAGAGALRLDGVNDLVDCGNDASINNLSTFSVSLWFRANSIAAPLYYPTLIGQRDLTNNVWSLYLHGDYEGCLSAAVRDTSLNPGVTRARFTPAPGQWYHVVMTYDDYGDRTLRLYVNGQEPVYRDKIAVAGAKLTALTTPVVIGNRLGGDRAFGGFIDDIRIYRRILTAAEIISLARDTQPVACWPLDVDGGDTQKTYPATLYNGAAITTTTGEYKAGAGALRLDGVDDYISHKLNLPVQKGTISHWLRPSQLRMMAAVYQSNGTTNADYNGFGLADGLEIHTGINNDKYYLVYQDGLYPDGQIKLEGGQAVAGQWAHVAVTWDRSDDAILYVDGQEVARQTMAGKTFSNLIPTVRFTGRVGDGQTDRHWSGILDDIRIYPSVLTPAEINQLATNP